MTREARSQPIQKGTQETRSLPSPMKESARSNNPLDTRADAPDHGRISIDRISIARNSFACLLLAIVATIVFSRDITVGGLRYSDACTHAMDGVLIHDWVAAGPDAWASPMAFATRQYAHYPLLGIGRVYPPGFAVVESAFFALFGISAITARACVVVFGVLAVIGCHRLAVRMMTPVGAAVATAVLLGMPGIVYWTRQTMLEMPTLCVLIWSVLVAWRYIERPNWWRWGQTVAIVTADVFFKQTAIFIVPIVGVWMFWAVWKKRIPWMQFAAGVICIAAPLAALFANTLLADGSATHTARVLSLDKPLGEWLNLWSLSYYIRALPEQAGWIVVVLAGAGMLLSLWRLRSGWGIPLAWFGIFFVMSVLIQHKETRYFFFGMLPVALWAGYAVSWITERIRLKQVVVVLSVMGVAYFATTGYGVRTRVEPSYTPLVTMHSERMRQKIVLFEGHRDGDFIFAAREVLGPRACVIIRGSKILYSCASDKRFDFTSYVADTDDVRTALDRFGFETVFVEDRNVMKLRETELLQSLVGDSAEYQRLDTVSLSADNGRRHRARAVSVYEPVRRHTRRIQFVDIPIPIASRTLRIDLDAMMQFDG